MQERYHQVEQGEMSKQLENHWKKETGARRSLVRPYHLCATDPSHQQGTLPTYQAEEAFWRQRSRQLWLSLGEKNTGYFHANTATRRIINNILVIENKEGEPVYEEDQILDVISAYFQQLFTSLPGDRDENIAEALDQLISAETNMKLIRDPTPRDIKNVIYSIHADKAPGPDGFLARFFQSNWHTVGLKIVKEVQEFFKFGILPRSLNSTHIRHISKVKSPKTLPEYRPIALCNVY